MSSTEIAAVVVNVGSAITDQEEPLPNVPHEQAPAAQEIETSLLIGTDTQPLATTFSTEGPDDTVINEKRSNELVEVKESGTTAPIRGTATFSVAEDVKDGKTDWELAGGLPPETGARMIFRSVKLITVFAVGIVTNFIFIYTVIWGVPASLESPYSTTRDPAACTSAFDVAEEWARDMKSQRNETMTLAFASVPTFNRYGFMVCTDLHWQDFFETFPMKTEYASGYKEPQGVTDSMSVTSQAPSMNFALGAWIDAEGLRVCIPESATPAMNSTHIFSDEYCLQRNSPETCRNVRDPSYIYPPYNASLKLWHEMLFLTNPCFSEHYCFRQGDFSPVQTSDDSNFLMHSGKLADISWYRPGLRWRYNIGPQRHPLVAMVSQAGGDCTVKFVPNDVPPCTKRNVISVTISGSNTGTLVSALFLIGIFFFIAEFVNVTMYFVTQQIDWLIVPTLCSTGVFVIFAKKYVCTGTKNGLPFDPRYIPGPKTIFQIIRTLIPSFLAVLSTCLSFFAVCTVYPAARFLTVDFILLVVNALLFFYKVFVISKEHFKPTPAPPVVYCDVPTFSLEKLAEAKKTVSSTQDKEKVFAFYLKRKDITDSWGFDSVRPDGVIRSVVNGSPAYEAGLRAGFQFRQIDEWPFEYPPGNWWGENTDVNPTEEYQAISVAVEGKFVVNKASPYKTLNEYVSRGLTQGRLVVAVQARVPLAKELEV